MIQIHQDPCSKRVARFINALISLPEIRTLRIRKGPKHQKYLDIAIPAKSVQKTWKALRPNIESDRVLSSKSIVACEGKQGWDDYELIYHWDADVIDEKWRTV
jgi:hypothetical protein